MQITCEHACTGGCNKPATSGVFRTGVLNFHPYSLFGAHDGYRDHYRPRTSRWPRALFVHVRRLTKGWRGGITSWRLNQVGHTTQNPARCRSVECGRMPGSITASSTPLLLSSPGRCVHGAYAACAGVGVVSSFPVLKSFQRALMLWTAVARTVLRLFA